MVFDAMSDVSGTFGEKHDKNAPEGETEGQSRVLTLSTKNRPFKNPFFETVLVFEVCTSGNQLGENVSFETEQSVLDCCQPCFLLLML